MSTSEKGLAPERWVALKVLARVEDGAFTDKALAGEARKAELEGAQRAAAMRLSFGAVQRERTLDWIIEQASERPLEKIEPRVMDVLRIGTYELLFSDGVPEHAAVDQAVRAARTLRGSAARRSSRAGLVNAVLRRIARDGTAWLDGCTNPAIRHSMPDWIAERLVRDFGDEAGDLMATANEPAQNALRWNSLRGPREGLEALLPEGADPGKIAPESYVITGGFDLEESEIWSAGLAMGQSQASMLPARILDPKPGERVLDLCSAPGAKATQIAALANNEAEIVAVELHEARAEALRRLAERMGARIEVIVGDGREVELEGTFDAILVDPPCTGTGVLSARPDARWRRREESLGPLLELQKGLLERALGLLSDGGRVVYSTCSLLGEENEQIVEQVDATVLDLTASFPTLAHPRLAGALQTRPDRDGTDGFFIAKLAARIPAS